MYPYTDLPIIDIHAHIMEPHSLIMQEQFAPPTLENARFMTEMLECCGYDALCIPSITLYDAEDLPCNPLALYAKCLSPGRIYAFAGLRRDPEIAKNVDMADQLKTLLNAGFDGVKMICKPNARRVWNVPIDDAIFNDFFAYLEEHQIPLLFHVGDPDSFWDPVKVPLWAKKSNWYYGDDKDIPDLNGLYNETEHMLEKFPHLQVVFAHFFFMSGDLKRAGSLMEKFPKISFDLTPGSEMYFDFSAHPDQARDFFIKYQDRIIFGTDNVGVNGSHAKETMGECFEKVKKLRQFFETDEEVINWGATLRGISLPKEVCRKIYAGNFSGLLLNKPPRKVDIQAASALCEQYLSLANNACGVKETLTRLKDTFKSFRQQ